MVKTDQSLADVAQVWPISAKIGRALPDSGQTIGQVRAGLGTCRRRLADVEKKDGQSFGQNAVTAKHVASYRPMSVEFGPNLGSLSILFDNCSVQLVRNFGARAAVAGAAKCSFRERVARNLSTTFGCLDSLCHAWPLQGRRHHKQWLSLGRPLAASARGESRQRGHEGWIEHPPRAPGTLECSSLVSFGRRRLLVSYRQEQAAVDEPS